jgi:hypothetical protein
MILTPEEKAKMLVNKFKYYTRAFNETNGWEDTCYNAKQCALIAVDEIIENEKIDSLECNNIQYWQEIKQSIKEL